MQTIGIPARQGCRIRVLCGFLFGCICLASSLGAASAQLASALPTSTQPAELDAATVVLTYSRQPVEKMEPEKFDIRMDGGKPFHPTSVRLEGDEPLNIAVLIDDSRDPVKSLAALGNSLAALTPGSLHPVDHVTIYAIDCAVARTMDNAPANAQALKDAVSNALSYGKLHGTSTKPACSGTLRLWDYAAVAIEALGKQPGRRVLVIVSGGTDKKSKNDWAAVKGAALEHSVAVFGLRDQTLYDADDYVPTYSAGTPIGAGGSGTAAIARNIGKREPRPFDLLCANTGGLVMNTVPMDVDKTLAELVRILRGRYILQFPSGAASPGATHSYKITVGNNGLFATAAGVATAAPPTP